MSEKLESETPVAAATTCSACGQEWYAGVEAMCIKRSACGFRAMRVQSDRALNHGWIKATDINRPGGWYWTRIGADDESCPQVVFIGMDNDGDAAPDFRVVCMGESSRTAKRLKQWADQGWEFMEVTPPGAFHEMRCALEKAKRALTMGADLAHKTETTDSQHRMADIVGAKLEMAESAVKAVLIRWPNDIGMARRERRQKRSDGFLGVVHLRLVSLLWFARSDPPKNDHNKKTASNRVTEVVDPTVSEVWEDSPNENKWRSDNQNAPEHILDPAIVGENQNEGGEYPRNYRCQCLQEPNGHVKGQPISAYVALQLIGNAFVNLGERGIRVCNKAILLLLKLLKKLCGTSHPIQSEMSRVSLVENHTRGDQEQHTKNEEQSPPCELCDEVLKEVENASGSFTHIDSLANA